MKIVIAPDSWKESLSALEVASAIEQGFREIYPDAEYVKLPVADGGEGTVEAMVAATGGLLVPLTVTGPLGEPVEAFYGLSGDRQCAFIEMAAASGLESVPPAQRNPLLTTSWGTGELIRHALDAGVRQIIIGIGGSATNDGGAGMAQALGAKLLTAEGQQIASGGGALETLARIDLSELDSRLADCRIDVACDVTNPLTGPQGASAVFGPQKGATAQMIDRLDSGLRHYARIIARDLDIDVLSLEGGGAAGGMGAALYAFCGAQLRPGIEIVTDALQLAERVADADLVITGERVHQYLCSPGEPLRYRPAEVGAGRLLLPLSAPGGIQAHCQTAPRAPYRPRALHRRVCRPPALRDESRRRQGRGLWPAEAYLQYLAQNAEKTPRFRRAV